jgi:hypothetical protein
MHEGKEIEIRFDRKSSRNWKSPLQRIWNDDSYCLSDCRKVLQDMLIDVQYTISSL